MNDFIAKYEEQLSGTLSGFDRLVFSGNVWKDRLTGMKGYLWAHGLAAKDFGEHAGQISKRVKEASLAAVLAANRPVHYLNSGKDDKQQIALRIAVQDGIVEGPICALSAVELCRSYAIQRNPKTQRPELAIAPRKCLFLYHYQMHPVFGFMNVRRQTWFPFPVHIYLNGREWLARQMDGAGIGYRRHDNCFTWVEDFQRAQTLLQEQLRTNWVQLFDPIVQQVHPILFSEMSVNYPMKYFWTCQDSADYRLFRRMPERWLCPSEWATDLVFRKSEQLRRLVPQLLHLGVVSLSSPDVLRFMGKKVTRQGNAAGGLKLPLSTDLKIRGNGARIKHRLGPNSIKLYDKFGLILRIETTVNDLTFFKHYREVEHRDGSRETKWASMQKTIYSLPALRELLEAANRRYLEFLSTIEDPRAGRNKLDKLSQPVEQEGRRYSGFNLFDADDENLLCSIVRGEFNISGLQNKTLRLHLPELSSSQVSRLLKRLRTHGLVKKVGHTYKYYVTAFGKEVVATAFKLRELVIIPQLALGLAQ